MLIFPILREQCLILDFSLLLPIWLSCSNLSIAKVVTLYLFASFLHQFYTLFHCSHIVITIIIKSEKKARTIPILIVGKAIAIKKLRKEITLKMKQSRLREITFKKKQYWDNEYLNNKHHNYF